MTGPPDPFDVAQGRGEQSRTAIKTFEVTLWDTSFTNAFLHVSLLRGRFIPHRTQIVKSFSCSIAYEQTFVSFIRNLCRKIPIRYARNRLLMIVFVEKAQWHRPCGGSMNKDSRTNSIFGQS